MYGSVHVVTYSYVLGQTIHNSTFSSMAPKLYGDLRAKNGYNPLSNFRLLHTFSLCTAIF